MKENVEGENAEARVCPFPMKTHTPGISFFPTLTKIAKQKVAQPSKAQICVSRAKGARCATGFTYNQKGMSNKYYDVPPIVDGA